MQPLSAQLTRLLELPSAYSRFTIALYEAMYTRGSFIAHFNRQGFYKARFTTLAGFDETLRMMNEVQDLKAVLSKVSPEVIANARYKIACLEANVLTQQARISLEHVERLQQQFTKAVI